MFKKKGKKKEENEKNVPRYNPNEACITCCHVLEGKPILYIRRDAEDGGYQFLCGVDGHRHTEAEARVVGVGEIVAIDKWIDKILPLDLEAEMWRQYVSGKGSEIKAIIQDGIKKIIQQDIADKKVLATQLYCDGEIIYENGRNGTWFDWNMNEHTSWFTVCYNDEKRMGYISVAVYSDGTIGGMKWGNEGKDEAEQITLGKLSMEDTEYLVRILLQQADDNSLFNIPIDAINWERPVLLESLKSAEEPE